MAGKMGMEGEKPSGFESSRGVQEYATEVFLSLDARSDIFLEEHLLCRFRDWRE
jgi:hypothetical protein